MIQDDEAVVQECIVCTERSELWGVGQCGHNNICAKCHYRMRAKQQNLHCGYCKNLNEHILIASNSSVSFAGVQGLIEYREGAIYFKDADTLKLFELSISCRCQCCSEKFLQVEEYKQHLRLNHWLMLCEVCLVYRPTLLSEQAVFDRIGLDKHMTQGEFDENENLLVFHPHCEVRILFADQVLRPVVLHSGPVSQASGQRPLHVSYLRVLASERVLQPVRGSRQPL